MLIQTLLADKSQIVTSLTSYIPNNSHRNGRAYDQTDSFGQVNLADDQSTDVAYRFYEMGTNTPVRQYGFFSFDHVNKR
eukprot:3230160-Pleurochrysis_carterae.AAC.1